MNDFIQIDANYDSMPEVTWTKEEAKRIWDVTDSIVPMFEKALGTQMNREIRHEWDEGLTFYAPARLHSPLPYTNVTGYGEEPDWNEVETQMNPKTRGMWEVLKSLVPLYLDANSKC